MPATPKPEPLTPLRLRGIKPPETGQVDIPDGASPGLALRVSASGKRNWTLRLHVAVEGKWRRFTLGDYSERQGIKWARDEAAKLRQRFKHDGHDPHQERRQRAAEARAKAERDRLTLGVLVEDWERERLASKSPRYAAEAVRALRVAFADQWDRPADGMDKAAVTRVLDGLRRAIGPGRRTVGNVGNRNAIAGRTLAYGRACYGWAVKRGMVADNPFVGLPADDLTVAPRDRVLTDDELAATWRAAEAAPAPFGAIVRLLILTGQRREEVAGLAWSEISDDLAAWTIPGARTKNRKPHIVPLSAPARDLLAKLRDETGGAGLVLAGRAGTAFAGWSKSKAALDAAAGVTGWRLHDLRRTLATGMQRLGMRLEVTEAVLNHISGSRAGIVGVYQTHDWLDEKRAALEAWGEHVRRLAEGGAAAGNVVALRRA